MEMKVKTRKKVLVPGESGIVRPRTKTPPARRQVSKVKELDLKDVRRPQRKLIEYWPALYRNGRIIPVAVGIREAMLADLAARGITINPKRLERELFNALNTENYQRRILFMKHRHSLDGKPVAQISEGEREYAYQKLTAKMTERGRTPPRPGFWKTKKAFPKKQKGPKPVNSASSS